MAEFGQSPIQRDPTEYAGQKRSLLPVVDSPRAPTILDRKYPIETIWRDHSTNDEWILVDVIAGDAQWRKFTGGGFGTVTELRGDDGNIAYPNAGVIDVDGNTVAAGTHTQPLYTRANVANTLDVDLQVASAQAAANINNAGIASFNSAQFAVDAVGFVSLGGGGLAIDQVDVDAATAPGTDPVLPSATGQIGILGATVANHNVPIETHSRAANVLNVEVQVAADRTGAPANTNDTGICSFDDTKFLVDANGYVQLTGGGVAVPGVLNIGLTYAAGVLTICSEDGTALSATNRGYVRIQSKANPGYTLTIPVIANQIIIDDVGASYLANSTFQTTAGIAWAEKMPFYIYAVSNDAENAISFMISRSGYADVAPAIGVMAKTGTPAVAQNSFFAFDNPTLTDYDANPCIGIGMITMQKSAADDWTVDALTTRDGIGKFGLDRFFIFPKSQNGAVANFYTGDAGTEPDWNSQTYVYRIIGKMVEVTYATGNCTQSGVGAGNLYIYIPLYATGGHSLYVTGKANFIDASVGRYRTYQTLMNNGAYKTFLVNTEVGTVLTHAGITTGPGDDSLVMQLIYFYL